MESMAVAYTERLMDTRLKIYTGKDFDYYFDTTKDVYKRQGKRNGYQSFTETGIEKS